ncbi:MAG: DUF1801 domain-containing protein [Bacteroidetes bacterium]|nr:DUF1801 domain-containing protein [Bacteroidota bacterium]
MKKASNTTEEYINQLTGDRKQAVAKLKEVIATNLPKGFVETIGCGMIAFVVPHSLYSDGYHCNPQLPLPFINIASQKNFISLYHMGLYAKTELLKWFTNEHAKRYKFKLDIGKSCIRFKKEEQIPYELLADLAKKMSVKQWVDVYEKNYKK